MSSHDIDWNDPAARAALVERIGVDAYNEAVADWRRRSIVATVNGHDIRPVQTRFGRLFMIDGTGTAYRTLEEAREFAAGLSGGASRSG